MAFTPLDVRSCYSLLKSPTKIKDLVTTARQRGYQAIALTDENVLYGAVDFYNAARKAGIKPILGLQMTIALNAADLAPLRMIFLAKDQQGYQHLMDFSTRHQTTDTKKLPLTLDQVTDLLSSLFVILPPQANLFSLIAQEKALSPQLKASVDPQSLLVGINPYLDQIQQETLKQWSKQLSLPLVAVSPVDYLNPTDLFAANVLQAIGAGTQLKDIDRQSQQPGSNYLRTRLQAEKDYAQAGLTAAVEQSNIVAAHCSVKMEFKAPVLPHFASPDHRNSEQYLHDLCVAGLKKRPLAAGFTAADYQQRLKHELTVIHEMGFDDYFLIVWDVMNFAHNARITTDPGRGSAAGSLVAYALAITEVDPLEYHLLFERFLNPERAQMPDIDLDIPDNRRDEVLKYVHDKYGHEHVGQIITFGTLAAKQVLRDVSRVFGLSRFDTNELLRTLPAGNKVTLTAALQESQRLRNFIADHPLARQLMQVAQQLEGLPRHYSIHAAGVVLSEQPLHEIVPLQGGGDEGLLITQFTKGTVEALGLLKMDFLGLKNLSILANTLKLVHKEHPAFDLRQIAYDDSATLRLFQQGHTDGVFQFESSGIRNVLVSLHPDSFEDIIAVNALYRPGPLENISRFIARKHGRERYRLPDPSLAPILRPTYGILVYQEQVMQLASAMAGFTLGEADLLRRAMSKKIPQVMAGMRTKFLTGAEKKGYSQAVAQQVFDYIDQFANYGFNRSHAVAYSKLAFQLAYLKCHYPTAFYTALMAAETNLSKLRQHVVNARRLGVRVNGPRINISRYSFVLEQGQIYFGLADIKGMRRDFTADIIAEREQNGAFKDLRDFINRLPQRWQKEDLLAPLIYAGAFDGLGYNRAEMIAALPDLLSGAGLDGALAVLFKDDPSLQSTIKQRSEYPLIKRLELENKYLGVYLSGHPASQFQQLAAAIHAQTVNQLRPGQTVNLILFVNRIKVIYTKRDHRQMAFLSCSDQTGAIDVTVFPKQYQQFSACLENNQVLVVNGRTEERAGRGLQLIAQRIEPAQGLQKKLLASQRWFLRLYPENASRPELEKLYRFMERHSGNVPVIIYYPQTDAKLLQPRKRWMNASAATAAGLKKLLGAANVVLQATKN